MCCDRGCTAWASSFVRLIGHQPVGSRGTEAVGWDTPHSYNLEQSPNRWTKSLSLNTQRHGWNLTLCVECPSLTWETLVLERSDDMWEPNDKPAAEHCHRFYLLHICTVTRRGPVSLLLDKSLALCICYQGDWTFAFLLHLRKETQSSWGPNQSCAMGE